MNLRKTAVLEYEWRAPWLRSLCKLKYNLKMAVNLLSKAYTVWNVRCTNLLNWWGIPYSYFTSHSMSHASLFLLIYGPSDPITARIKFLRPVGIEIRSLYDVYPCITRCPKSCPPLKLVAVNCRVLRNWRKIMFTRTELCYWMACKLQLVYALWVRIRLVSG